MTSSQAKDLWMQSRRFLTKAPLMKEQLRSPNLLSILKQQMWKVKLIIKASFQVELKYSNIFHIYVCIALICLILVCKWMSHPEENYSCNVCECLCVLEHRVLLLTQTVKSSSRSCVRLLKAFAWPPMQQHKTPSKRGSLTSWR